jgi:hypothetical protein
VCDNCVIGEHSANVAGRLLNALCPLRDPSEMHSKIACDHNDHDHYADDVKDIHCFTPIEITFGVQRHCDGYWYKRPTSACR